MDDIQRWLKTVLADDPPDITKEALLQNMRPKAEQRSFWLSYALMMSDSSAWWYDLLVEHVRRSRRPYGVDEIPMPPRTIGEWCIGVAAGDIKRPKSLGRPANAARDQLIGMALEKYRDRTEDGEAVSESEACGRVADVVGLDDSVVAKIWRRHTHGQ